MEEQVMRRGEIYHADLNPVFGSEQGGYRRADHPEQPGKSAQSNGYCCGYYEPAKDKAADTCADKRNQWSGERVLCAVGADPDSG